MAKKKNELQIESALPQILELKMALEDGIENAKKLIGQYDALISAVSSVSEEEQKKFPDNFINEIKIEKKLTEIKKDDCEERLSYARILLDEVEQKTEKGTIVLQLTSLIYGALGILAGQQEKYQTALNKAREGE